MGCVENQRLNRFVDLTCTVVRRGRAKWYSVLASLCFMVFGESVNLLSWGANAMEMDYVSAVVLSNAPFGGPALRIEIQSGNRLFRGIVWGKGFSELAKGRLSLALDNKEGPTSTGRGEVCTTSTACTQIDHMRLRFERIDLRAGGGVYGYMTVTYGGSPLEYPFGGTVELH